jgi:two-component system response regulator AdeR
MFKILFAQSDPKLVELYRSRLSRHFGVDSALDGLTAVRKFRLNQPRVVVSDYHLPRLSGLALLKFVRSTAGFAPTPFLFLAQDVDADKALNLGANDCLDLSSTTPDLLIEKIYLQMRLNQFACA